MVFCSVERNDLLCRLALTFTKSAATTHPLLPFSSRLLGMVVFIAVIATNSRECPLSSALGSPTFLRLDKPCRHMTLGRVYYTANPHRLQRYDDAQSFILAVSSPVAVSTKWNSQLDLTGIVIRLVLGPVGWCSDILHHLTLIFTGGRDPLARLFLLLSPSPRHHHDDAAIDYSSTLPCPYGRRTLRAGPILRLFSKSVDP